MSEPSALTVVVRGAGGMATGIAIRLLRSGISRLCLLERPLPLSIHRLSAFAEAVLEGYAVVEGATAALVSHPNELPALWNAGCVGVLVDPGGFSLRAIRPDVIIDTTHDRHNGLDLNEAPLVIGLRPMHTPGVHAHLVIETSGPGLGRVLRYAVDMPRAGISGHMSGFGAFIVHAPHAGVFRTQRDIGEYVEAGEVLGSLAATGSLGPCGEPVRAPVSGTLRGLLRDYVEVEERARLAYIDPRDGITCHQLSDRVLAVGGGVLEAILSTLGAPSQPKSGMLSV